MTTEEMIRDLQQRIRNSTREMSNKWGRIVALQGAAYDAIDAETRWQIVAEIRDLRQAIARDERNIKDMERDIQRLQDERSSSAAAAAPPSAPAVSRTVSERSFKSGMSEETAASKDEAEELQKRAADAVSQSKELVARTTADIPQVGLKRIILETLRDLTKRGANELASRMPEHAEWIRNNPKLVLAGY